MTISKETVLSVINETGNNISRKFNETYSTELSELAENFAVSYSLLYSNINTDNQESVPDNHFQSMVMFWTGLNTVLAAVELFCRGYNTEPQALVRNSLEIFASAYEIHKDVKQYQLFRDNPEKFDSTKSIKIVKEIHPLIGNFYGLLSDRFSHVSIMHTVPHKSSTPLCVGGLYDPEEKASAILRLSMLTQILEILSSVLEFALIEYPNTPRYWKKVDSSTYLYTPDKVKGEKMLQKMEEAIKEL